MKTLGTSRTQIDIGCKLYNLFKIHIIIGSHIALVFSIIDKQQQKVKLQKAQKERRKQVNMSII